MATLNFIRGRVHPEYPKYIIYENGDVYSMFMNSLLKKSLNTDGYVTATLKNHGKGRKFQVHRLVALMFLPNPRNLPQVNHKDKNRQNNNLDNLEWITEAGNIQHAIANGGINSRATPVYQFTKQGKFLKYFKNIKTASEETKTSYGSLQAAVNGKCAHAGGFFWSKTKKFVKHVNAQCKPVEQICLETGEVLASFESATAAEMKLKIMHVGSVCKGTRNSAGGFSWRYKEVPKIVKKAVIHEWDDWAVLERFPKYKISRDGRIYSESIKGLCKLTPRGGYIKICLVDKNGVKFTTGVHRLVAMAYIPNPRNLPKVNHKDFNGLNNSVENLEWITSKGNSQHAADGGRMNGYKKSGHKFVGLEKENSKKVGQYSEDGTLVAEHKSIAAAARSVGVIPKNISVCCNSRSKQQQIAEGFIWKFIKA